MNTITFSNLWNPMENFKNALYWTMIRDSYDSPPGFSVPVVHACTNKIFVFVFMIKNGFTDLTSFVMHVFVKHFNQIYMHLSTFSNHDKLIF